MIGVMAWAELEKSQAISDVMTVTDEAFIHLVIRNYEDRWTMMAERTQYIREAKSVLVSYLCTNST